MTTSAKLCARCDAVKPTTAFSRDRTRPDGLRSYCRDCSRALYRQWKTANPERAREHDRKTGQAQRGTAYSSWRSMKARCLNPNASNYANWGGRGIKVCERWRNSFANFLADMGRKPSPAHSIDRIDNDGNYEPGNCRWVTWKEPAINRRPRRAVAA